MTFRSEGSMSELPAMSHLPIGSHRLPHDWCKPGSRSKPLHVDVTAVGAVWKCFRCPEAGSSSICRKCGLPISFKKLANGKWCPTNPDGSDHECQGQGASSDRGGKSPQPIRSAQVHDTLSQYGRDLWADCNPIAGIALDYLQARRCVIPPIDGDLRWHPKLKHPSGYEGAALVALCTDAISCEPRTLHRTWIRADGRKADVDPERLLLKDHRKKGAVIRLWPDECVTTGLGIAEGIETSLCAAHAFTPMWSCIDAGNMAAFPVLAGIEALTIFADHDRAGLDAADELERRWHHAEVTIVTPERPDTDFADEVSV
jgi:putative DNA primase/helicase